MLGTITAVNNPVLTRVFVIVSYFYPSLNIWRRGWSLPKWSQVVVTRLISKPKYYTRVEMTDRDKHSSLLRTELIVAAKYVLNYKLFRRHDTQHNDTQHNDIQHSNK